MVIDIRVQYLRQELYGQQIVGIAVDTWGVDYALLDKAGLEATAVSGGVSKRQRWDLACLLTAWPIRVTGPRDFQYAEVTIGGIRTDEIDPHTLQSYVVPGLYFAGEMVDVHADLGGYNFQWAWASGYCAGQAA